MVMKPEIIHMSADSKILLGKWTKNHYFPNPMQLVSAAIMSSFRPIPASLQTHSSHGQIITNTIQQIKTEVLVIVLNCFKPRKQRTWSHADIKPKHDVMKLKVSKTQNLGTLIFACAATTTLRGRVKPVVRSELLLALRFWSDAFWKRKRWSDAV